MTRWREWRGVSFCAAVGTRFLSSLFARSFWSVTPKSNGCVGERRLFGLARRSRNHAEVVHALSRPHEYHVVYTDDTAGGQIGPATVGTDEPSDC